MGKLVNPFEQAGQEEEEEPPRPAPKRGGAKPKPKPQLGSLFEEKQEASPEAVPAQRPQIPLRNPVEEKVPSPEIAPDTTFPLDTPAAPTPDTPSGPIQLVAVEVPEVEGPPREVLNLPEKEEKAPSAPGTDPPASLPAQSRPSTPGSVAGVSPVLAGVESLPGTPLQAGWEAAAELPPSPPAESVQEKVEIAEVSPKAVPTPLKVPEADLPSVPSQSLAGPTMTSPLSPQQHVVVEIRVPERRGVEELEEQNRSLAASLHRVKEGKKVEVSAAPWESAGDEYSPPAYDGPRPGTVVSGVSAQSGGVVGGAFPARYVPAPVPLPSYGTETLLPSFKEISQSMVDLKESMSPQQNRGSSVASSVKPPQMPEEMKGTLEEIMRSLNAINHAVSTSLQPPTHPEPTPIESAGALPLRSLASPLPASGTPRNVLQHNSHVNRTPQRSVNQWQQGEEEMALTREIQMLKEQHREAEVQNVIDALNMEVNVLRSQQDEQDEMAVKLMELQALQQSVFQEHIHSQQTAAAKQNLIDEQQRAYLAKLIAYQRSLHGTLQQGGIAPKPPQEPLSSEPIQTQPTPSPKRRTKKASPRKRKEAPSSIPETPISQELSRSEDADEEELAAISVLKQLSLERYAMCFSRNHITEAMLRDLTDAEMEEIGVAPLGHRLLIRKWQDKLRKKEREKSVGTTTSSIAPTSPGVTRTRANSSLPRIPNISLGRLPTTEKLTTTSVAAREQSANASYKELQQFQEHLAQHVASVSAKTDKTDETLPKKDSGGSSRRRYPTIEELEKRMEDTEKDVVKKQQEKLSTQQQILQQQAQIQLQQAQLMQQQQQHQYVLSQTAPSKQPYGSHNAHPHHAHHTHHSHHRRAPLAAGPPGPPRPPQQKQTWSAYLDKSSNRPYFVNNLTRETQWEEPANIDDINTAGLSGIV